MTPVTSKPHSVRSKPSFPLRPSEQQEQQTSTWLRKGAPEPSPSAETPRSMPGYWGLKTSRGLLGRSAEFSLPPPSPGCEQTSPPPAPPPVSDQKGITGRHFLHSASLLTLEVNPAAPGPGHTLKTSSLRVSRRILEFQGPKGSEMPGSSRLRNAQGLSQGPTAEMGRPTQLRPVRRTLPGPECCLGHRLGRLSLDIEGRAQPSIYLQQRAGPFVSATLRCHTGFPGSVPTQHSSHSPLAILKQL